MPPEECVSQIDQDGISRCPPSLWAGSFLPGLIGPPGGEGARKSQSLEEECPGDHFAQPLCFTQEETEAPSSLVRSISMTSRRREGVDEKKNALK